MDTRSLDLNCKNVEAGVIDFSHTRELHVLA